MNKPRTYDRGTDLDTVRVLVNGQETNLQRDQLLKKFDSDTVVRIPESVYPDDRKSGQVLSHFGLPIHGDPAGSLAVLPRILEHGFFRRNGEERLPLLSFENVWLAEIVECYESISYDDLSERFFEKTIGEAKDIGSLKELILNRYRSQLPDRSEGEILSENISVRFMKLIKKVSFSETL